MKKYTEYTKSEKEAIVKNGGDNKRELEKAFNDFIFENRNIIDIDVLAFINSCDPMIELYHTCGSLQEVISLSLECMQE